MNTYYLASSVGPDISSAAIRYMIPTLTMESANGLLSIALDGTEGWVRMPGSTGLFMPPVNVVSETMPGVPGALNTDVRYEPRPVFLPIYYGAGTDQVSFLRALAKMRKLVDPIGSRTFKLIGRSALGVREMDVTYTGGLEGNDAVDVSGLAWAKIGLTGIAHNPFTRQQADRSIEFRVAEDVSPFLGQVGGTDAPWPGSLTSGTVIGEGMPIEIFSEVPVYPTLKLVGPMTSFFGELAPTVINPDGSVTTHEEHIWSVSIPDGVPAGSEMLLVTDPRARSFRLDGALAAGRVARGSTLRAFYPGMNTLNVTAPGGTETTSISLSWREQFQSLW